MTKKSSPFSTIISSEAKEALQRFCLKRGLKINHFIEEMIWDRLEEEMDNEISQNESRSDLKDISQIKRKYG